MLRRSTEIVTVITNDSYERKLSNHHDQGRRQGATAIIEFLSVTRTSENFEGARGRLCSSKGGACATAQWHNGQSKPGCDRPMV